MIWYDYRTGEPVAPGEAEDGGPPSFEYYYCPECGQARELTMKMFYMLCAHCRTILLTNK